MTKRMQTILYAIAIPALALVALVLVILPHTYYRT
jgi:hypothetical protein